MYEDVYMPEESAGRVHSRIFINKGVLYKETPLGCPPYVIYDHEGIMYGTKPGKVYLEAYLDHPGFNWYLQNYDTAALGSVVSIAVQSDESVEFYFDSPERIDTIAEYYSLTRPFASEVLKYKSKTLMSIRFNSEKEAYLYKGYTTFDDLGLSPVGKMYIDELDDTLWVYHEFLCDENNNFKGIKKHMYMEKDTSAVVETKPGPLEDNKITIDGVLYYPSDYDYIDYAPKLEIIQGDPWVGSNVTKLHE